MGEKQSNVPIKKIESVSSTDDEEDIIDDEIQIAPSQAKKRSGAVVATVAPVVRKRKKREYGSLPGEDSQLPEPYDTDSDIE